MLGLDVMATFIFDGAMYVSHTVINMWYQVRHNANQNKDNCKPQMLRSDERGAGRVAWQHSFQSILLMYNKVYVLYGMTITAYEGTGSELSTS